MAGIDLSGLLNGRGDDLDRWARAINPQFVRVLRTIDFDRTWERAEGAKCERCWKYSVFAGPVCDSCASALKEMLG